MIGSCDGGASIVQPGTVTNQSIRWSGTQWVPSSALKNDGTQIGFNTDPVAGQAITIKGLSTGGNKALQISDSGGTERFYVKDNGNLNTDGAATVTTGSVALSDVLLLTYSGGTKGILQGKTELALRIGASEQLHFDTNRALFSKPFRSTSQALIGAPADGNWEFDGTDPYFTSTGQQRIILRAENVRPDYTVTGGAFRRDLTTVIDYATLLEAVNAIVNDLIIIKAFR